MGVRLKANWTDRIRTWFMNHRAPKGQAYIPTDIEHIANVVTHGMWILPSMLGMVWMLSLATTSLQYKTSLVYGFALLALFTVSTTFHTVSYTGQCRSLKDFFHIGDRAVIYVFIAASYTPWLALKDCDGYEQLVLWVVWISAFLGIIYQYRFHEQYKWLETLLYLVLGICPAIIVIEMKESSGLFELMLGGIVYVTGVFFFKCDGLIPCAHAIWHCFVFVGAIFHYCAVCKYLLGPTNLHTQFLP